MDAIRYLDADTILDYLHNSSETYLEGLIPQSYGFPTETDRSVYVRLLRRVSTKCAITAPAPGKPTP